MTDRQNVQIRSNSGAEAPTYSNPIMTHVDSESVEFPTQDAASVDDRTVAFLDRVAEPSSEEKTLRRRIANEGKKRCGEVDGRCALNTFLPFTKWLPDYEWRTDLARDIMAGVTICVLLIPQGMAYGQLASIPPIYGLYTAFFAPLFYAIFGTSRQLSFGTMAVVTIMTGDIISRVSSKHYHPSNHTTSSSTTTTAATSVTSPPQIVSHHSASTIDPLESENPAFTAVKVAVLASTTLLMGLSQLVLGVFRFGYAASLMPEPLTRAFTTGCACYVFGSELKHLFGIEDPGGRRPDKEKGIFGLVWTVIDTAKGLPNLNWGSFIIGACCIVTLYSFKAFISPAIKRNLWPSMPMEIPIDIVVVVVGTLLSWGFDFDGRFDVAIVGKIPTGLPTPALPDVEFFVDMIPDCIVLGLVSFAISISLAKIVAKRNNYEIDPNADLVAYGLSNSIGSFFHCMPSSGCISRTLLLDSLGTKSQFQAMVSSLIMLLVLMVLGKYFQWLPNSILAAIIITAIRTMFLQVADLPKLWRISKYDFLIWVVTFLSTVFLDVPYGLIIGIPFALLLVVARSLWPELPLLGRVAETGTFEDTSLYSRAIQIPHVKIVRLDAPLFYGNAETIRDAIFERIGVNLVDAKRRRQNDDDAGNDDETNLAPMDRTSHVIIDCEVVFFADYVGVMTLGQIVKDMATIDIETFLVHCGSDLVAVARRAEEAGIKDDIMFLTMEDALRKCAQDQ